MSDIRMGEFTLRRGHTGRKRHEAYRVAYDEETNSYSVHDSHGSEITEEMEDCHDLDSSMQSVLRYAAKLDLGRDMGILDSQKDGGPVFSVQERSLILQYAYKMDSCEKAEELADALAYCREEEPVNLPLIVIDAEEEINAFPDRTIGLWATLAEGCCRSGSSGRRNFLAGGWPYTCCVRTARRRQQLTGRRSSGMTAFSALTQMNGKRRGSGCP